MKTFWKNIKNIFIITIPTLIVLFVILELFFRFIIPASDPPRGFYYEDDNMYAYNNKRKSGKYTIGRFAEIKTNWQINNFGWNYPIDYYPVKDKKLIAVIGDSYIEAFQVDADEKYPYQLRKKLFPEYEVFAFGISGAPLSQYLHISRYVNKHFKPDILIFNLFYNDFDESIRELYPNRHDFLLLSHNVENNSFTENAPSPDYSRGQYRPFWQKLLNKSSLVRYILLNLDIKNKMKPQIKNTQYEANINPNQVKEREALINKSTAYLVNTIKNENKDKRIIFIFDAPREAIYNNTLSDSRVLILNKMMKNICQKNDVEFIDLTESMQMDFEENGIKFNSEFDAHWNEYGHEFVSKYLYNYLKNNK